MTISNTQQILIPKKVYIGDTAELSISFNYPKEINGYTWQSSLNLKDYDIHNVTINKNGVNYYQIVINFTPWKTGNIDFPDLELITENVENRENGDAPVSDALILQTDSVQIVSLVEQNQVTGLQGIKNPMLIPGTTYKLYGLLITFVLLILILIRTLIKRKHIAQFIKERKQRRKYLKNKKQSLRALSNLLKPGKNNLNDDKNFAASIQNIMRNYMEIRFEYPFTKSVASEISRKFSETTCGLLEEKKYDAVQEIEAIFIRTDYIRYGNGSFIENEKNEIVENLKKHIDTLETLPPKEVDIH